jgi:hypothetical protein
MLIETEGLGNPPMSGRSEDLRNNAPVPATPASAALEAVYRRREEMAAARQAAENRLPRVVHPRDEAVATGAPAQVGQTGEAVTAKLPLARSSGQLMNASGPRRTG